MSIDDMTDAEYFDYVEAKNARSIYGDDTEATAAKRTKEAARVDDMTDAEFLDAVEAMAAVEVVERSN